MNINNVKDVLSSGLVPANQVRNIDTHQLG